MSSSDPTSSTAETVEDRELEKLLTEAFDAPPMPRSLLKRIDRIVEQEWGQSPDLARSKADRIHRGFLKGVRAFRGLPIATAVVLIAVVALTFQWSSPAYAWTSMVSALERAGLVEVETNGTVRWLALNERLAGETTPDSSIVMDANRSIILRRTSQSDVVERQTMAANRMTGSDRLVLAFLMGDTAEPTRSRFLRGGEITSEDCRDVTVDGESQPELTLSLRCGDESGALVVRLDSETQMPVASRFSMTPAGSGLGVAVSESANTSPLLAWRYRTAAVQPPSERVAELAMAAVIRDVDVFSAVAATSVAVNTGEVKTAEGPSTTNNLAAANGTSANPATEVTASTVDAYHGDLDGAASNWKAVELRKSATGHPVQDLDLLMTRLWSENQIQPVSDAAPEELLRRVYLDLVGRTPSVSEVRDFLKEPSAARYEQLVERLLNSADHTSHLAAKFRSFLIPEGIDLTNFGGIEAFEKWLSERFSSGESYDKTVQQLLLAEGRLVKSGPLLFYSATRLEPDQLAGRTARVFLGMRLECAQCHDHPFEPWTQEDFWGFAAFFGRISRPQGKLETVSTVMQVKDVNRGEVTMPESKDPVAPKYLNSDALLDSDQTVARRRLLTQWLTGKDNPYFARATANRVWSMLFGKGIVNPVDDFGVGNKPVSAELLDLLAGQFIQSDFNLKDLFRTIVLSKAYRLSSGADDVNESRMEWFAQMNVKMLTAEQVYDCITVATMPGSTTNIADLSLVARFGNTSREQFLREFRTPSGRSTEYQGGIPQALTLMNGSLVDGATGLQSSGLLKSLEAPFFSRDQRIEILYFATLARSPKASEKELLEQFITDDLKGEQLREALSDVLWALLNSAEFTMNH